MDEFAVSSLSMALVEADLAELYTALEKRPESANARGTGGIVTSSQPERIRGRVRDLCLEGYLVRQKRGRYSLTHQGLQRFLNQLACIAPDSPVLSKERSRKSVVVDVRVEALEDGRFLATCFAIQGCHAQGDTVGEALENLEDVARAIFGDTQRRKLATSGGIGAVRFR